MITWIKKQKFNKLIKENLDGLFQLAYMRCTNKELAEDLVQETCIKALNSYLKKDFIENPKAWLYRILINTHIDHTRKKQLSLVDIEGLEFADNNTPNKNAETNIFFKDLNTALTDLDTEQRAIIYLSDIEEYSYKEVSEILEIPLGTVMSRIYRARQSLRKSLVKKGYSRDYVKAGES